MKKVYKISYEKVHDMYLKIEEIYSNISLIKLFCKEYYEVEDIYKIKSIIDYTYKTSDQLYADLINIQES